MGGGSNAAEGMALLPPPACVACVRARERLSVRVFFFLCALFTITVNRQTDGPVRRGMESLEGADGETATPAAVKEERGEAGKRSGWVSERAGPKNGGGFTAFKEEERERERDGGRTRRPPLPPVARRAAAPFPSSLPP